MDFKVSILCKDCDCSFELTKTSAVQLDITNTLVHSIIGFITLVKPFLAFLSNYFFDLGGPDELGAI